MTVDEIRAAIWKANPKARASDVEMYARQFVTYWEAVTNIAENGAIVAHPRTGQPMDNPYLKLRDASERSLKKFGRLQVDALWKAAAKRLEG